MEKEWEENIQKLFNLLNHFGYHGQYCSENVLCVIREKVTDILVISGVLENQYSRCGEKIRCNIEQVKETLKYHAELVSYFYLKIHTFIF